ncbi:MAG: hypothetical protein WKF85_14890 [Chitinophagaceae bacterium]
MMNIEKLNSLARTDFTNFIESENNVKYKIVIPFLQSFNHVELDLEHAAQGSRIDINIGNRIIVETKALPKDINQHVQQLSDYSGKELPVLAILTNGRHFRIYSPMWRNLKPFAEKIIYEFELKDLTNILLLNHLEKILGFSNYESEEFLNHIEQRERELIQIKREIENIKLSKLEQTKELENEVNELKEKVQEINDQIKAKEQIVSDTYSNRIPEISIKISESFFPVKKSILNPIVRTNPFQKLPTSTFNVQQLNINTENNILQNVPSYTLDSADTEFKIENQNRGVIAYGKILPNGNFLILEGSKISNKTAAKFQTSSPSAFKKRQQYLNDKTINSELKFTRNVEFNSKSGAASLILGDSADGNRQWRPVK